MTGLDMTNKVAFECFKRARDYYVFRLFELAQQEIKKYKQGVDYQKFDQSDRRTKNVPQISVVVVSHQAGQLLLSCLQSVFKQEGPSFEVILVDNGGNEEVYDELAKLPLLTIKPPVNVLPSEGRNIGGHFSRGQLIIFLDDDALMVRGYLDSAFSVMADESLIGLRGKVISKTPNKIAPKHYSLGDTPTEAEFNLEGNMVIRKTVFDAAGGFDALMFGHEGKELTQRCKHQFSDRLVQYRPELCIEHDFAEMASLDAKRERQSLGQEYLIFLENKNTIKGGSIEGLSILVRAGDDLAGAKDFLESLIKHNSYKPIEVLLWAKNTQDAIPISLKYLSQIFIRVLPASMSNMGRIGQQARYNKLMILDLPMIMQFDCLLQWIAVHKTDQVKASLYSKKQFEELCYMNVTTDFKILNKKNYSVESKLVNIDENLIKPIRKSYKQNREVSTKVRVNSLEKFVEQQYSENDFIKRYSWLKQSTTAKGIPLLENNSENFSNQEVHRCDLFPPYIPTKEKKDSPFKILVQVGDRLAECLSYDAEVISLDINIWHSQLALMPNFVLFESDSKVLNLESDPEFKRFLNTCIERGVPTVFWHTDAKEHCSMYCDIANLMGYVGAVEQESVEYYEKNTNVPVRLLEHAIQPALHNAIREERPKPMYSNMKFFFDGWADLIEYRDTYTKFLEPICDLGLHIFESKWQFMKNKLRETPQFLKNIHGSIGYRERLTALKHFDVSILAFPSMKSSSTLILEALEAIASKCVVLYRTELDLPMLSGLVNVCEDDSILINKAKQLINFPAYRAEHAHLAWRYVQSNHTFVNRLNTLAEWINLPNKLDKFPSIASITITKRPEMLLKNAKKNYLQQNIDNKEWIVVLNTLDVDLDEVKKSLMDLPKVRIFQVSSDKNIGFCLNMAIGKSQSDYWAKMDDDDFYGPNYLKDYLLNINSHKVDIIGKVPSFTYLEAENSIYIRNIENWSKTDVNLSIGKLRMCGATFCGNKVSHLKVRFSESIRSAVDSNWFSECVASGLKITISDCYEMTIFRASDKTKHTWRLEDEDLKNNAHFVMSGIGDNIINI